MKELTPWHDAVWSEGLQLITPDTYQDVQGTFWAVFELSDGGKDWKDETGEDQEEAGREEEKSWLVKPLNNTNKDILMP